MTADAGTIAESGRVLDIASLCAEYPDLARPWAGWTFTEADGRWYPSDLPQFPPGWMTGWDAEVAADALAAERMHWETVNGTLPPAHSMLEAEPGPPVLYAVRDEALEPLPGLPHGWLDRMEAELAGADDKADAAVVKFTAIHGDQRPEDTPLGDDGPGDDSAPEPGRDDKDTPSSDSEGPEAA